MAKVSVCVVLADCCVVLADRCVALVLELQAARLSRATEATATGTRLVLIVRRIEASGTCSGNVHACYAHLLCIRLGLLVTSRNN